MVGFSLPCLISRGTCIGSWGMSDHECHHPQYPHPGPWVLRPEWQVTEKKGGTKRAEMSHRNVSCNRMYLTSWQMMVNIGNDGKCAAVSARAYHLYIAIGISIYCWLSPHLQLIQIGSLTNSKIKEHLLLSLHEVATSWEFHINAHTIYI